MTMKPTTTTTQPVNLAEKMAYARTLKRDDPIEILCADDRSGARGYLLTAWVSPAGVIQHSMCRANRDQSEARDNLQAKGTFPHKAVEGWQAEYLAAAATGLYDIVRVR